jgi:hypothetical protein
MKSCGTRDTELYRIESMTTAKTIALQVVTIKETNQEFSRLRSDRVAVVMSSM